ncbi:MAG TPA: hypothetical protein VMV44_11580 [Rectinemataceae bacterium]|nr:hypothetical protein [Rectinemataceae bacterium]
MRESEHGSRAAAGLRRMLALGGVAALLSMLGALADIAVGTITGGSVSALPPDAAGRLTQLAANPLLGLYNLDLLNLVNTLLMVPALYACWLALRREGSAAGLALVFGIVAAAVFVANNSALAMLGLSGDWATADPSRRSLLAAAGEALLAKGAHGSPGVLPGFLLSTIANLILSGAMLRTRAFGIAAGILGIAGNLLLGAYLILVTFLPQVRDMALAFAAPGGLLAIAWMFMMALRLFRLSRVAVAE